jgi:hypothetical protein
MGILAKLPAYNTQQAGSPANTVSRWCDAARLTSVDDARPTPFALDDFFVARPCLAIQPPINNRGVQDPKSSGSKCRTPAYIKIGRPGDIRITTNIARPLLINFYGSGTSIIFI